MPERHTPQIPVCKFGLFEVDFAAGELRKRGMRIKIQEQPFRILSLLLEEPGQIVSREAIRKALWPAEIFVDFEQSIRAAVAKLRVALGDSAENPRFIETVARQGYRFIAPVTPATPKEPVLLPGASVSANSPSLAGAANLPPAVQPGYRRLHVVLLALVAGLAAIVVWVRMKPSNRSQEETVLRAVPLTSYPGNESGPSFSPDGTRMAFAWDGPAQDNVGIYVKLIGSGDPMRLTREPAKDHDPAWSPDGNWIAFLRDENDTQRAILLIPSLGGAERIVSRVTTVRDVEYLLDSPLLTWSADEKSLYTLVPSNANAHAYAVARILVETGETQQVTFPPAHGLGDHGVAAAPDGQTLAFTRQVDRATTMLYRLSLSATSPPARQPELVLSAARVEGMAWTADSRDLVFSGEMNGRKGLWRIKMFGPAKPLLLNGIGQNVARMKRTGRASGSSVAISRDGHQLVYTQGLFDINIWRLPLNGGPKRSGQRFLASTRDEFQPDYSPDGRKIAFESDRSGSEEIWACNADGSAPYQVTNFGRGWSGSPRWSPDGRRIAFDRLDAQNRSIYVVDSQGGKPARVTAGPGDSLAPSWSRDGKYIYFVSDRSGSLQVWRMALTGASEVQITKDGGNFPNESMDGKDVYYSRSSGAGNVALWKIPASGGNETLVVGHLLFPRAYDVSMRGVYFMEGESISSPPYGDSRTATVPLRFLDFRTRKITNIGSVPGHDLAGRLAVSPDERWLLYGHDDGTGSDLMLVGAFR